MQALITGAGGFAGRHLTAYLAQHTDWTLYGSVFEPAEAHDDLRQRTGVHLRQMDLCEAEPVHDWLAALRPDYIFHLAALSAVGASWRHPWRTLSNNIRAQLNILEALVALGEAVRPRVLVIGSADQYGLVRPEDNPIDEDTPFRPNNPYAVSKITQEMLGLQYFYGRRVPVVCVRAFNHIGPGQHRQFVAPDFASQIAQAEAGRAEAVMYVGNLEAQRDFTDVRDVVRAYHLAITQGTPGAVYNVGSGQAHSIRELLDTLLGMSKVSIEVRPDPDRMRPSDVPLSVCDAGRLRRDTGWAPQIPFVQSLADVLEDWRQRAASGAI